MAKILVYWIGIIGIPGKGPNWSEPYDPNKTIGQIIQTMTHHKLGEQRKRIEILKYESGDLNKYDKNNPYWSHDTRMIDYVNKMGGSPKNNVMMIYVIV